MAEPDKPAKVKTEGSARVLNEVKGRLEHLEAGEMPVIERVGPDGTSRRVDHTGEMVRPAVDAAPAEDPAIRAAAEAFAAEHSAGKAGSVAPKAAPKKAPAPPDSKPTAATKEPAKQGFFARILAIFRRS